MEKKSYTVGECEPLTKMNSEWLLRLLLLESSEPDIMLNSKNLEEMGRASVLGAIIAKRILAIDAKFTFPVVLFGALICDRPGTAVLYLIDILNILGKGTDDEPVTLRKVCEKVYPNGFRTEKSFMTTIDEIKSQGKDHSEFAYLY